MNNPNILEYSINQQPFMLAALKELVSYETPSTDKKLLDLLASRIRERFQALGLKTTLIENSKHGNHLLAEITPDNLKDFNRPALILCHYDTVWPEGTLEKRPLRYQENKAWGPGIFDMKASIVITEFALKAIFELEIYLARSVRILITSDEELLSPSSRTLIEEYAKQSEYVLVMEPSLPEGELKTARKGTWYFTLEITGKAAHAGIEPEKGASAIKELAHQILQLSSLANPSSGTTVNVGVVRGGTQWNIVADHAEAELDIRVWTLAEEKRIQDELLKLNPITPGTVLHIKNGFKCPPMERNPEVVNLFNQIKQVGSTIGLDIKDGSTGGGSDANFVAALGIPTIDGLGALGNGAHGEDEHIFIDSLPQRTALLATILKEI